MQTIAYFVSSHGLGHATRTASIIEEIHASRKDIHFLIISDLPTLFWQKNLDQAIPFTTYRLKTDIGLFQTDPLHFDLIKSVDLINQYLSKPADQYGELLKTMEKYNLCHVACDISPLGIIIANYLGIKKTLIENFTWDWIYQPYIKAFPSLKNICTTLQEIFASATLRIQVTPFCEKVHGAIAVKPIHRSFRMDPGLIRKKLNIKDSKKLILVAANGIDCYSNLKGLIKHSPYHFIFCGENKKVEINKNITLVPLNSSLHFPDLIRASSAVVGKVGYGMTVECWAAKTHFFGIMRENFRESEVLKKFIINQQIGKGFTLDEATSLDWSIHFNQQLKESEKVISPRENGNRMVAKTMIQFADG